MYLPMLSDDELVRYVDNNPNATECEKRLAQRIHDLQTELNEAECAAESAGNEVADLQREIDELNGDITDLKSEIATLQDTITNLKKHY